MSARKKTTGKKKPVVKTDVPTAGSHDLDRGHGSRVDELSANSATHQERAKPWERTSALAAPPAREGYIQRWIRRTVRGEDDPMNLNRQFRKGWSPRAADTIPEEWMMFCVKSNSGDGVFAVNDLVLCEMDETTFNRMVKDIDERTALQMYSVEVDLENSQIAGGPQIIREQKSTVSHPARQIGRRLEAADNE